MSDVLRAGPASIVGLQWLARVGPAPMGAWACAMGWGERAAQSHSRRLEAEGWLRRYPMTRGQGSLLVATDRGVRMAGIAVSAPARPAPTWWAHDCACAWTAAWLSVRDRDWRGPREVLCDPGLKGKLEWMSASGWRRAGHRPDLAVLAPSGLVIVEVELRAKAEKRLHAILGLYGTWLAEKRISGVMYVCADQAIGKRIATVAPAAGVSAANLRTDLLKTIRSQAESGGGGT